MKKVIPTLLGPLLCLVINVFDVSFINAEADAVISVGVWMIIWWVFEVVSISVTALIPILMYPLLGIKTFGETTTIYGSPIVFLFLGGFLLALALEKVELHRRLALSILKVIGTNAGGIIWGFILSTALLSMWISNTATTLVLMPIGLSVADYIGKHSDNSETEIKSFKIAIMLAIAFAANIGGTATIIGTPPNVVLVGFLESELGAEISFIEWSTLALPFAILMLIVCNFIIRKMVPFKVHVSSEGLSIIEDELRKLGRMSKEEWYVTIAFGITILAWMVRVQLNGLSGLNLTNGEIAMWGGFTSFVIPVQKSNGQREWLLLWDDTKRMQWGILIMFGGGLALADGLSSSGIIQFIGDSITSTNFSIIGVVSILILVMTFMTTLMSNVALVAVFAPILLGVSKGLGLDFMDLGIPMALASSCAFMLPMSTPPNAIVYTSGVLKVYHMLKVGFFLNIVSVLLLIVLGWILINM